MEEQVKKKKKELRWIEFYIYVSTHHTGDYFPHHVDDFQGPCGGC